MQEIVGNDGFKELFVGHTTTYQTTKVSNNGTSIKMSYDLGGSSMKQIYGETTTITPGIIASFNSNGELVLESTRPDGSLSVSSENGGIFQKSKENISDDFPSPPVIGYISNKKAYIDGVNILEPIEITKWNSDLSFDYSANGVTKNISFRLDKKNILMQRLLQRYKIRLI